MNEDKVETLPLPDAEHGERRGGDLEGGLRRLLQLLLLGHRGWKRWWVSLVRTVGHEDILAKVEDDATFSFNYAFMVAVAAGIAIIGLLLNSPAVIIGAMLISPLMGPIVSVGFAIAGFDVALGRRCAGTLVLGAVAAIGFAAVISLLSPVKELTPEILARTRPNLLDLAVAILSGAAGGYAMIRGRGGAIVGVAIATALMPPLAVVGYGLATWQGAIFRGALLLFVTNMAAIALAVAAIAEWYGFGRGGLRKRFATQALIALLVLAPLAVPLYISLRSIAWESRVHSVARSVLDAGAQRLKHGQLAQFRVRFRAGTSPFVEAIMVGEDYRPGLESELREAMEKELHSPVELRLTLLHADDPAAIAAGMDEEQARVRLANQASELAIALRNEVPFPLSAVEVNAEQRSVVLVPAARDDVGLSAWRDIETSLAARHGDWQLTLIPPASALPPVMFKPRSSALDAAAEARLEQIVWAIGRWQEKRVRLVAHADSTRSGLALARRRIASVSDWLAARNITVQSDDGASSYRTIEPLKKGTPASVEVLLPLVRGTPEQGR